MDGPHFPLHRKLGEDLSWYRIGSPTEFTEVQRIGSRYVAHRVRATIYPEKLRVAELIAADQEQLMVCSAAEFEAMLAKCAS